METLDVKPGDKALILITKYGSRSITRAEIVRTTPKQAVVRLASGAETRWWLDGRGEVGSRGASDLMWSGASSLIPEGHERYRGLLGDLEDQRRKQAMIVALREAEKAPEDWDVVTAALDALSDWHRHLDGKLAEQEAGS